jgi:glutamate-1-semialdehyde 2,1-aminomutase
MLNSKQLFAEAQTLIPGGVNSPVRAFRGVGGEPIFFKQGSGAYVTDVDDNNYIDYVGSWGPLILGHCHPTVVAAVVQQAKIGMSFGAPTDLELHLAQKISSHMPSIEKIRMVNSGTEATMTAIRLARGYTQKSKIIKFTGCYHGHSDSLLVKAGSGLLTLGIPSSLGILPDTAMQTLTAEYNDLGAVVQLFEQYGDDIAAVIVEPIAGNMGFILPKPGFLTGLRAVCDAHQSLLIFDEVMTGFRVGLGGAQALYQIKPDLTTLGKVIGGGLPVGAVGGRKEIMNTLAPLGGVYQAGTLSGNPLAMAAGLATLQEVEKPNFYVTLEQLSLQLISALSAVCDAQNVPFYGRAVGGMFGFCFSAQTEINNQNDVAHSDEQLFKRFYHGMLQEGVYFAPSLFEAGFMSSAHQLEEIHATQQAAERVLSRLPL